MKTALLAFCLLTLALTVSGQNENNLYILTNKGVNYQIKITPINNYYKVQSDTNTEIVNCICNEQFRVALNKITATEVSKATADSLALQYKQQAQTDATTNNLALIDRDKGNLVCLISLIDSGYVEYKTIYENTNTSSKKGSNSPNTAIEQHLAKIQSVQISFEDGLIKEVLISAFDKNTPSRLLSFYNRYYIPIRNSFHIDNLNSPGNTLLVCPYDNSRTKDSSKVAYIDLSKVLTFERNISSTSGTYIPADTTLVLTGPDKKTVRLYKPSIAECFDLAIFTDAFGFDKKQPNGLIQAEIRLSFPLRVAKNKNTLGRIEKLNSSRAYRNQWIGLTKISPYITFNKIESGEDLIIPDTCEKGDVLDLYKYSKINIGTEITPVELRSDSKDFSFNIALGIFRTKIKSDSLDFMGSSDVSTLYANPNIKLKFYESNKVDFDLIVGTYLAWQVGNIKVRTFNENLNSFKSYAFDISNWWLLLQQSINIHPNSNKSNSVFLRTSQHIAAKNNYFTFQIGYTTSFSNIFYMK